MKKSILVFVTSHDRFGTTEKKTGYYLPEVSHAVARFLAAGYDVDFASPKGGAAPVDPSSVDRNDADSRALLDNAELQRKLNETLSPDHVDLSRYAAVFFAGGMGTMWDFAQDARLGQLAAAMYERGGVVSAVCHGPAALLSARLSNGTWLVEGREIASFSNAEERAAGHVGVIPYMLESELTGKGARYQSAPLWQPHVAVSDRLVTGQNPASTRRVAEEVVRLLTA
jgi:putative intracellular protease/amidase